MRIIIFPITNFANLSLNIKFTCISLESTKMKSAFFHSHENLAFVLENSPKTYSISALQKPCSWSNTEFHRPFCINNQFFDIIWLLHSLKISNIFKYTPSKNKRFTKSIKKQVGNFGFLLKNLNDLKFIMIIL